MSEATTHSKPDTSIAVPFLVFSALLLALLIPDVILRKPIMSPEMRQGWVMHHQATQNFILARKFVVARLSSPTTSWSADFQGGPVGLGVWFAQGTVQTVADDAIPWKILFVPGNSEPLYLRVGSHEEGSYAKALARAGLQPGKP